MKPAVLAMAVLCLAMVSAGQKAKKPADVTVIEPKAHRADDKILVDGTVRVTAQKPLKGLTLVFDLLSPENGVTATEKIRVEEETVEAGQERAYHAETADQVRSVRYRIRAFDNGDRELRVENSGPFPIE